MITRVPPLVAKSIRGGLLTLLCLVSPATFADTTITFLGSDTNITDRNLRHGKTLSDLLTSITGYCETLANNTNARKPKNKAKKRLRVQVGCLKEKVKKLEESDKNSNLRGGRHGHHSNNHHDKNGVISKTEKKTLLAIIRQFRKDGGIIVTPPVLVESVINGRITTPSGAIVPGVAITAGADQTVLASTNANGTFSLLLTADTEYALKLSADGYATQVIPVQSPDADGSINLDFTMIERGAVQTFDASTGGTISGNDGAAVTVAASSFIDANGDLVSGDIQLTITPVDVSNSATLGAFPGEFTGIQADSTETPIISLGTVEYKFTQNGQEVQLDSASSATAEILIPIYIASYQDGSDIQIGDEIPLWSLNEVTGIWLQEGTGLVVSSTVSPTGLAMQATVTHFTWWNCDVTMNAGTANITVTGSSTGTATIQATVSDCNIGWRPTTVETVINIGETASNLRIPSACNVCYSAELALSSGSIATTDTQCATTAANGTLTLTLQQPNPGPLNLTANGSEDPIAINGVVAYIIPKVQLLSTTTEDSISYSVISAQALPAGLSLNAISATQAEIVGIPTEAGEFAIEVQGVDATGTEIDSVTINYTIIDPDNTSAPVFVNNSIYFSLDPSRLTFDLKPYNVGETATSWSFEAQVDGQPVPTWFSISNDGIVSVNDVFPNYDNWKGNVRATNAAGSVITEVEICTGDCISTPTPAPGDYQFFLVPVMTVNEYSNEAVFTVSANQPVLTAVTFNYTTAGGSATAGEDFTSVQGIATIPAGENRFVIRVPLINDAIEEDSERFSLILSNLSTGTFVYSSTVVTIRDDDGLVIIAQ